MEIDPIKLLAGLNARKLIILLLTGMVAVATFFGSQHLPRNYESRAIVQVSSIQRDTLTGRIETNIQVSDFLGQQAAIAKSRTVALVVLDLLLSEGYLSMSDFIGRWREETGGEAVPGNDARLWAADQLLFNLTVQGDARGSSLIFTFTSRDAGQAAKLANTFANAYMQVVLDQRQRRASRAADKFTDETFTISEQVESAADELTAYRTESGIIGLGTERLEAAEVEYASLTGRVGNARADFSEASSRLQQARKLGTAELLNLPLATENLPGRQAQVRLGALLIQLNRVAERFGPNYPDYQELLREKRSLEQSIMESIENRLAFTRRRLEELSAAAERQKKLVLDLQKQKQKFDQLQNTLQARRNALDLVSVRSLQESLQSRLDVIDVMLLSRAVPATEPSLPPIPLLVIVGTILGLGGSVFLVLIIELIEARVRVGRSLEKALKAPLLGEFDGIAPISNMTGPRQRQRPKRLSMTRELAG